MGAWQVGVLYNHLDLTDQGLNGAILDNLTAGLNWFWNPNMKWQFFTPRQIAMWPTLLRLQTAVGPSMDSEPSLRSIFKIH